MKLQTPCPDHTQWQALLDDSLTSGEESELSRHVEQCEKCRQYLDSLCATEQASGLTEKLKSGRPEREAGLQHVIATLKERGSTVHGDAHVVDDDDPLAFLNKSATPGQLGRIDEYDVLEIVGRGAMGIVLKAFDRKLQRIVALKVMAPRLATSASGRKRFVREARAAAAIRNEHVIDIHAVGEAYGLPYMVMEYISGVSLQERLNQKGALEVKEILRIGMQAARGLAAAHAQGMIHRDIKPANILLENGVERVKLTDFGLARAVDDATLTQSGVVAGTPQYMSPEQAHGETLDARSDLFSLGSVLYALCTGRAPFRAASTMAVLKRICDDTPRDVREIDPGVPVWLSDVIRRLHAKDPAKRFQSAAEVADVLAYHLAQLQHPGQPTHLPMSAQQIAARGSSRGFRLLIGGLLLLTLGTAAALFAPTVYRFATNQGQLVVETDDPDVEVSVKQDGEVVQIVDKKSGRTVTLKAGQYKLELGDAANGLTLSTDQFTLERGGKEIVKVRRLEPKLTEILRYEGAPEATHIARFCLGDRCVLSGGRIGSRDGLLAPGTDADLHLWDRKTGKELARLPGHIGSILAMAISPDGKRAVTGGGEEDIEARVWDLENRKELRRFSKHTSRIMCADFLPDGRRVVTVGGHEEVRLWDTETGEEIRQFKGHTHEVKWVAVLPDGKRMLTTGQDSRGFLWDLEKSEPIRPFEASGGTGAISPDGRYAAISCWDRVVRIIEIDSGTIVLQTRPHDEWQGALAFTPDGRHILSGGGDRKIRLWEVKTGKEIDQYVGGFQGPSGVMGITADGKEALIHSWDGSLRLLRMPPLPPAQKK